MRRAARALRAVLLLGLAHFALAMAAAFVGFGLDVDQLRSRSPASRVGAAVHDFLMFPHGAFIRALPNAWLVRAAQLNLIPVALIAHSLLWGVALYALARALRRIRRRG